MKKTGIILLALASLATIAMAKHPKTVTLRLVGTTDIHGMFFPYDFTERRDVRGTMARTSTWLKRERTKHGRNLLLLDAGDILQGQPTSYYYNYVNTTPTNVAAEVINYLNYDAQTIGNHDVEAGHAVFDKWIREVSCPMLGANIIDLKSQKPYVEPYAIMERDGVRIAVLGMLTPAIPNWLPPKLWTGMRFEEMVSSCRRWVKLLREKEQADIVVGLFHSGWQGGIVTDDYDEDATRKVAEQVDGFDIIFFGHDHRTHNSTTPNGTLCLNPANNAQRVAAATLQLTQDRQHRWRVTGKQGELVDITGEEPDPDYMRHFEPWTQQVEEFISRQIGVCDETLRAADCFFGSAPFTDYVHRLQLEMTHADVSFTAPLTFNSQIQAGPVYMSDMFKLYRFENQVYTLRMTGGEIRRHLEMSYDLWVNTMQSPDDHIMRLNNANRNDNQRSGFQNYTFNFDSAAGIDYEVDVTRPDGQKVRIFQFTDGRPFSEDAWYSVVMNSYRANGGGELLVRGAGIPMDSLPGRITYMSDRDLRHYMTQKIERERHIAAKPLNNWRFVPEAWAEPAIRRDRALLFDE